MFSKSKIATFLTQFKAEKDKIQQKYDEETQAIKQIIQQDVNQLKLML